jgi:hypothetical protein
MLSLLRQIRYHWAMKNLVATTLVGSLLLSGCSFGMQRIDPQWDGKSQPQCDRRIGLIVADRILAGALAGGAVSAIIQNSDSMDDTQEQATLIVAAGFATAAIVFLVSSAFGSSRRDACKAADEKWAAYRANELEREPAGLRTAAAATAPAAAAPAPNRAVAGAAAPTAGIPSATPAASAPARAPAPAAAAAPTVASAAPAAAASPAPPSAPTPATSSFFCTSSASRAALNLCLADHPACEHARQVLSNDDLSPCTASRTAFCFDSAGKSRCFGTPEACANQRTKAAASATECAERAR